MVGRYILSVYRCVLDDLFKNGIDFCIVFNFNQCFDQCYCKSGTVHVFGKLHCVKHFKLLSNLFSHYATRKASCVNRLCSYPCSKCLEYYLHFFTCKRSRSAYLLLLLTILSANYTKLRLTRKDICNGCLNCFLISLREFLMSFV